VEFVNIARIPAGRERVWSLMQDIQSVGQCVPGVERLESLGDDRYRGAMRVKVGPIALNLEGDIALEQRDQASATTRMRAQAADRRVNGSVQARVSMQAIEISPAETELVVRTEASVLGRLGEFGQPVMRKKADQIMAEFATNVARRIQGAKMQIAVGTYDHTRALKDGSLSLPDVSFEFVEVSPITRAFRGMVTQQAYDVSEMALATYLLARVCDKPIVGLPVVLVRSTLLPGLVTVEGSSLTDPRELQGKRLGIRSYTQTSGVWVRGILADAYDLDLKSLEWVTFEGPHVDEYQDPINVTRAPAGTNMLDMLKNGELAATIGVPLGEGLRTLIPDAAEAEAEWASKSGVRTVNHILVVKKDLVERDPSLPRTLTDIFERARASNGGSVPPIGIEPNRKAFETLARYAYEQGITPRKLTVEEQFPYS
jgi:4,5-dihydroxyphthalate decarboxylase